MFLAIRSAVWAEGFRPALTRLTVRTETFDLSAISAEGRDLKAGKTETAQESSSGSGYSATT
jgi:hypothetical protein